MEDQEAVIRMPRNRNAAFEPVILPKYQMRTPLFNGRIRSMYSFGITNQDIKSHPEQVYNVEVPPELINRVTDAVMGTYGNGRAARWKNPPLSCIWTRCG
jgi:transposase-like protein